MEELEIDNPRYPHVVKITRLSAESEYDPFKRESERTEEILYEGEGRSFTDTTTEGDKNVDENKRKVSIPVRFDKWEEGKQPLDGDIIEVLIGNNREVGMVKDSEPDNNRTIVYWNFRRV
ncbi:MAG: hypothetical protein ACI4UJ_00110 [Candidatus Cryptobacteroides sp.]